MVKLPRRPPAPSTIRPDEYHTVDTDSMLWRIHRTVGRHVTPGNQLRCRGPTASRFDPHPEDPPNPHTGDRGVTYTATDPETAIAEVFQSSRVVDTITGAPYLTGWTPTRRLQLLDLTGSRPLRNGASRGLTSRPKSSCRTWAQAIADTFADLDGLWSCSSLQGGPVAILWTAAEGSSPPNPQFSRQLSEYGLRGRIAVAVTRIGYTVI